MKVSELIMMLATEIKCNGDMDVVMLIENKNGQEKLYRKVAAVEKMPKENVVRIVPSCIDW